MLPYKNLLTINTETSTPIYLQVCNGFIKLIKQGVLGKGVKLPGSRQLSTLLEVHRKTVVSAYEELELQGWIHTIASKGTYVSPTIPEVQPNKKVLSPGLKKRSTGFSLVQNTLLHTKVYKQSTLLEINDGLPDIRLAPMDALARSVRAVLKGERGKLSLSYGDIEGNPKLRSALSVYLNETRGFDYSVENVCITRGSIMGLYLSLSVLIKKGDYVMVAELGYNAVNLIVLQLGGKLIKVPIDQYGLVVDEIEKNCQKKKIRAIYVTPHHHYPTTVTMPPENRMRLLAIAEKYGMAILEDDYDYDYHFSHSPYLPLATTDPAGMVVYIGSFSKTFSPAFRMGYVLAPENFILEITKLRRVIDRQGDSILEHAMAELFKSGEIRSHLRRSHGVYKKRRDFFCERLTHQLGDLIQFKIPEGGLALWAKFDDRISLPLLAKEAVASGLYIQDGSPHHNQCIRMGYASLTHEEIDTSFAILKKTIERIINIKR